MIWTLSHRADPRAKRLADRHYSRQKPDAPQFVPPGRCIVLLSACERALWVATWPEAAYVRHAWAGAWLCNLFRNEGAGLSSDLIRQAVAATRWLAAHKSRDPWGEPPRLGMVTFVDAARVRHKRDPGRCFVRAGWGVAEPQTTAGGLLAFQLLPDQMPEPAPPLGVQMPLEVFV